LVDTIIRENSERAARAQARTDELDKAWCGRDDVDEEALVFCGGLYRRPSEAPGWVANEDRFAVLRPKLMAVLRERKQELRRHVLALAKKYEGVMQSWNKKVERQEKERAVEQRRELNFEQQPNNPTQNLTSGSSSSFARRSRVRSSLLGGDGIIRSDYEQEMVRRRTLPTFCI
jgi:hypothetical protein